MEIKDLVSQFRNKDLILVVSKEDKTLKALATYFLTYKISCDKTIFLSEISYHEITKRDYRFLKDLKLFAHELNTCTLVFTKARLSLSEEDCLVDPNIDITIVATPANTEKDAFINCCIKKNRRGPVGTIKINVT